LSKHQNVKISIFTSTRLTSHYFHAQATSDQLTN